MTMLSLARRAAHGRRRTVFSLVTAGLGVALTVSGVVAGAAGVAGVQAAQWPATAAPLGGEQINPGEEAAAQQAFSAAHAGGFGLASPQVLSAALQRAEVQAAAVPMSAGHSRGWILRGPTTYAAGDPALSPGATGLGFVNLGGRVTTLAASPQKPSRVWAGAADGGVWRSDNQGRSWTPVFDHQSTLAIGSIAVDPTNPNRVFVGTGEANTNGDAYYGNGVYVTSNAGRTWSHVHLPGVLTVFHVEAAAPSRGYRYGRVFAATNNGLWLSTDRGRHFANVKLPTNATHTGVYTSSPFGNFVTDVRVRPHHPEEVLAVVGWRAGSLKMPNGKAESVGNGFYRSTSFGKAKSFSFVPQTEPFGLGVPGNNANPNGSSQPIGRTSLAYSADGKYLWAVVQDAGTFDSESYLGLPGSVNGTPVHNSVLNGVYVSTSASPDSWTPKGNVATFGGAPGTGLLVYQGDFYGPGVQSWYDQWIAVDPRDDSRVLVGLEEIYEAVANSTTPAGYASWRTVARYWNACTAPVGVDCSAAAPGPLYSGKTTHPDQHAVAMVPLQNGATLLYAGSDGGVFSQTSHTTDLGYNGYENAKWNYLNTGLATTQPYYAVEGSDGTVYAGLQDNGEVKILPDSTRGGEVYGGDGFDTLVSPDSSNIVYEEYTYGVLHVSTSGGSGWSTITPSNAGSSTNLFATPLAMDPKNPNHIVEVGRYIDESTAGPGTSSWAASYDLGVSKVNGQSGISGAGANNVSTAVTVDGAHVYVGYCGVCDPVTQSNGNFAAFHNGIATNVKAGCSARTGNSACWHKAAAKGLPNRYIQGIAIDPRNARTLYVALAGYTRRWYPNPARGGTVYVSHDGGEHFTNITGNLPGVPANTVVLRNGAVYVGTDLGVYTASQSTHPNRWSRVGANLPNASVMSLRLNPDGSHLVAATHGRGVWIYDFGHAAAAPYRAHGLSAAAGFRLPGLPVRLAPGTVTAAGLLLMLLSLALRFGRRPRRRFVTA